MEEFFPPNSLPYACDSCSAPVTVAYSYFGYGWLKCGACDVREKIGNEADGEWFEFEEEKATIDLESLKRRWIWELGLGRI